MWQEQFTNDATIAVNNTAKQFDGWTIISSSGKLTKLDQQTDNQTDNGREHTKTFLQLEMPSV